MSDRFPKDPKAPEIPEGLREAVELAERERARLKERIAAQIAEVVGDNAALGVMLTQFADSILTLSDSDVQLAAKLDRIEDRLNQVARGSEKVDLVIPSNPGFEHPPSTPPPGGATMP